MAAGPLLLLAVVLLSFVAPAVAWLDYYKIMRIERSATLKEVKRAFRVRALELHPDKNSAPDAEAQFRILVEAYEVLGSHIERQTYDAHYAANAAKPPPPPAPPGRPQQGPQQQQQRHGPQPDYREFFRDFDESMKRHFEEHLRRHQQATGLDSEHMRQHMEQVAAAHRAAVETHHRLVAGAGGAGQGKGSKGSKTRPTQALLEGLWDDADEDPAVLKHFDFIENQGKPAGVGTKRAHDDSDDDNAEDFKHGSDSEDMEPMPRDDDADDGADGGSGKDRPRACPVCGEPTRARNYARGSDGHCHSCYTSLWRDASRISQKPSPPRLTGDITADLAVFAKESLSVGRKCRTNACPPKAFHYLTPISSRCTRCRAATAIRLLPQLAHRLWCKALETRWQAKKLANEGSSSGKGVYQSGHTLPPHPTHLPTHHSRGAVSHADTDARDRMMAAMEMTKMAPGAMAAGSGFMPPFFPMAMPSMMMPYMQMGAPHPAMGAMGAMGTMGTIPGMEQYGPNPYMMNPYLFYQSQWMRHPAMAGMAPPRPGDNNANHAQHPAQHPAQQCAPQCAPQRASHSANTTTSNTTTTAATTPAATPATPATCRVPSLSTGGVFRPAAGLHPSDACECTPAQC